MTSPFHERGSTERAGHRITNAPTWKNWVTPKAARERAIHRWYLFPHSFTSELVHSLIDEWNLDSRDRILDPFIGAGTTLLAAKEKRIPSSGYDLSPLAVLVSNTKTARQSRDRLEQVWHELVHRIGQGQPPAMRRIYPDLVRKALPEGRLEAFDAIGSRIAELECPPEDRDFFKLALIAVLPHFSHAAANGGWLRWSNEGRNAEAAVTSFKEQVALMLSDIGEESCGNPGHWKAEMADARALPDPDDTYSAVITSPPYPNRHDYTRVFGVELMFGFLDWEKNRKLRHQTFHSHPEARPERPQSEEYTPPESLEACIAHLRDPRIKRMLHGYFLDMYLCLREVARVSRKDAKVAFVVGNARYDGKAILVDELTAEIGERTGLSCQEIRAVRWRGNSAQQMGRYGRVASRESIIMFTRQ